MPEPTEESLLALLRRWKCQNSICGIEHKGHPSDGKSFRSCPECGSESARTHEVFATSGLAAEIETYTVIPKKPSRGVLASMALSYDHAIFMPTQEIGGFVDGSTITIQGQTPVQIASTLTTMMKLYETISGFLSSREGTYSQMLDVALRNATDEAPIA